MAALKIILAELEEYEPFLYSSSASGISQYIHFRNLPAGLKHKMRISNHPERERYGYKWQLRLDGMANVHDRKQWSKYFDNVNEMIVAFRNYYEKVRRESAYPAAGVNDPVEMQRLTEIQNMKEIW